MPYGTDNINGLKTQPSSKFGTPELATFVIEINDGEANSFNVEGEYLAADSNYSKAVRGLQAVCDVYAVFEPSGSRFTALVRAGTTPFGAEEEAGDGGQNAAVGTAVSDATGFACTAWNAEISGDDINYD